MGVPAMTEEDQRLRQQEGMTTDSDSTTTNLLDETLTLAHASKQADQLADLQSQLAAKDADIRFLLGFVPAWAKEVPEGLDPTFYGTLTAAGDREVKARVDAIIATQPPTQEASDGV